MQVRRKFDAFNRMSASVVHELKNIETQLSLMMKNAKRLHDNPEIQQDMPMTVERSLDNMRQLMRQLHANGNARGGNTGREPPNPVRPDAPAGDQIIGTPMMQTIIETDSP